MKELNKDDLMVIDGGYTIFSPGLGPIILPLICFIPTEFYGALKGVF